MKSVWVGVVWFSLCYNISFIEFRFEGLVSSVIDLGSWNFFSLKKDGIKVDFEG